MSLSSLPVSTLGTPRIGPRRELKSALESYWSGRSSEAELLAAAAALRAANWARQHALGITCIPSNDFSLYDHVLDTAVMVGAIPEAYGWTGEAVVQRKAEWPRWTPPAEMVKRWPHLKPVAGGMNGGPENPLGARALYLFQNGHDTVYRIHGTNEPETIGRSASSGCIRMRNIDVIDLFNRVPVGARVVVV